MIVASALGQIFQPIFKLFGDLIAFFYAIYPNYAVAITLLTLIVMIVTAPLTIKGTTSMMAMQRVAPEMKKLQQKYKGDKVKQNEELMALYKEHNVNPISGCLPLILQMPVFFILYGVIDGLINIVPGKHPKAAPRYVVHSTLIYHHLRLTPGKMTSFGVNLASKALSHHSSIIASLPFWGIVAAAIVAQYFQMSQMNRWNPDAAKANSQTQMMQKYMPIIMAIIYVNIPAGVNVYFVVSSVCRIGIQEGIFRWGKKPGPVGTGKSQDKNGVSTGGTSNQIATTRRPGIMERVFAAQQRAIGNAKELEAKKQAMLDEAKQSDAPGSKGQQMDKTHDVDSSGEMDGSDVTDCNGPAGTRVTGNSRGNNRKVAGGQGSSRLNPAQAGGDTGGAKEAGSKEGNARSVSRSRDKRNRKPR
ncbi:MAG: YidC/Oxa1 family membrane protein insertase [Acidimicrobiales bacterium]